MNLNAILSAETMIKQKIARQSSVVNILSAKYCRAFNDTITFVSLNGDFWVIRDNKKITRARSTIRINITACGHNLKRT